MKDATSASAYDVARFLSACADWRLRFVLSCLGLASDHLKQREEALTQFTIANQFQLEPMHRLERAAVVQAMEEHFREHADRKPKAQIRVVAERSLRRYRTGEKAGPVPRWWPLWEQPIPQLAGYLGALRREQVDSRLRETIIFYSRIATPEKWREHELRRVSAALVSVARTDTQELVDGAAPGDLRKLAKALTATVHNQDRASHCPEVAARPSTG